MASGLGAYMVAVLVEAVKPLPSNLLSVKSFLWNKDHDLDSWPPGMHP